MENRPLIVDIFRGDKRVGVIRFAGNLPTLEDVKDASLSDFVERSLKTGIDRLRAIRDGDKLVTVREPIKSDDSGFPLAFIEWLRRHGFDVRERHPEVDEEIQSLLTQLPGHQPLKAKIAVELPQMNYLEKTLILESLRRRLSGGDNKS